MLCQIFKKEMSWFSLLNKLKMTLASSPGRIRYWMEKWWSEKWNITLISDPNGSLHRHVCPLDKHDCPCRLSNLSQFVLKALQGPEDPSVFMAHIYGDATQYLSAPAFRDLRSSFHPLAAFCFGRGLPSSLSRVAGITVVKSLIMRLGTSRRHRWFHGRGNGRRSRRFKRPLGSTWALLTPLVHADS